MGDYKSRKLAGIVAESLPLLRCIGVALDPRNEDTLKEDLHTMVSFPRRVAPPAGDLLSSPLASNNMFVSKASLEGVVCLRTQKSYGRCIGLYVEHGNGTIEVLGQWDPADKIYELWEDRSGGKLDAVTFVLSDLDRVIDRLVEDIVVGRDDGITNPTFVWDDTTKVSRAVTLSPTPQELLGFTNSVF
jgi:hypothetical protein